MRALALVAAISTPAFADPDSSSGIDGALFRHSYDSNGAFSVEGARLLPVRDLSLKIGLGYGRSPIVARVPGIGDASADRILDQILALDLAFGMTLVDRVAIGFDVAAYRTSTGAGYGVRGRYRSDGIEARSTGLVALRPLSNIDQSADPDDDAAYLGAGLAGPLDARAGLKVALVQSDTFALTAIGSIALPFGDDEMLLGDRGIVFEPMVAAELRPRTQPALRLLGNASARIRKRTILESYDPATQAPEDARVFLDVGSEFVVGAAALYDASDRFSIGAEARAFVPLPDAASYGGCLRYSYARCSTLDGDDYVDGASAGDFAALFTAGIAYKLDTDVTATLQIGSEPVGMRGETFRIATGIVWAPQPAGTAAVSARGDRDGDRVPDAIDACPDEVEDRDGTLDDDGCIDRDNDGDELADADDRCPDEGEDRDGFEDDDGCPEPDNDRDAVPDAIDRCAADAEDMDGFEDDDGCPDLDNDKDGFADKVDRCPDDAETINNIDDTDGCPDVRATAGPEERADRIDLKGAPVAFTRAALTPQAKQLLGQVAAIVKARNLTIRVEVHVPLGTRSANAGRIAAQKQRDKTLAQQRAKAILDHLIAQGVPIAQVQAVGIGSDRPLGTSKPTDPINERVDIVKAQQGGAP